MYIYSRKVQTPQTPQTPLSLLGVIEGLTRKLGESMAQTVLNLSRKPRAGLESHCVPHLTIKECLKCADLTHTLHF